MTSVSLKTFIEMPVASAAVTIGAPPNSEAFWNATTHIISQSPQLQEANVMASSPDSTLFSERTLSGTHCEIHTNISSELRRDIAISRPSSHIMVHSLGAISVS